MEHVIFASVTTGEILCQNCGRIDPSPDSICTGSTEPLPVGDPFAEVSDDA